MNCSNEIVTLGSRPHLHHPKLAARLSHPVHPVACPGRKSLNARWSLSVQTPNDLGGIYFGRLHKCFQNHESSLPLRRAKRMVLPKVAETMSLRADSWIGSNIKEEVAKVRC